MSIVLNFSYALLAAAWLVPNHYAPWSSAWSDALAIVSLVLILSTAALGTHTPARLSWRLTGIAVLCCAVILAQLATGKLLYVGDAWMAIFYVGLWWAAILAGGLMAAHTAPGDGFNRLAVAWIFAAILSVGIALVQWTGALSLGIYGADLPPGWRPFGNVAQSNHLCTICFLGLCGAFWLHQRKAINGMPFGVAAGFLILGMVMTQSRTGWVQIGLLVVWAMAMRTRAGLRISRSQLAMLGVLFASGVLIWPVVCDALLLTEVRSIADRIRTGTRLPYWLSMLDAIGREPLWGFGWQQVAMAQQRVALDHPSVGGMFEHAHSLVLDLLLWNGIPIGGFIVVVIASWFVVHIRACHDPKVVWMLAAVGGVLTHGMLEFPLEYAYFLIPVGLAMGAIDSYSTAHTRLVRVTRWTSLGIASMLAAVFVGTATDYLKAEENYRTLRMESARIGAAGIVTPAPELRFLTQLEAFLQFARIEAVPNMQPEQITWLRMVSQRFGYPPVQFRYALAAGLNGQPQVAQETLALICRIHVRERCTEAKEGWAMLQARYPELAGIKVTDAR